MSNLFVVTVGTVTRRGNFVESVTRYVQTDADECQLLNYMLNRYIGMEVRVFGVKSIDVVDVPVPPPLPNLRPAPVKKIERLGSFEVGLGDKDLAPAYDTARKARLAANEAESALKEAIAAKIKAKSFVACNPSFDNISIEYGLHRAVVKNVLLNFTVIESEIEAMAEEVAP